VSDAARASSDEAVNLKDPGVAALLAWLLPGAGHLYQGRTGKGVLFMVCILGTFFYGLFLGEGRVVYAAFNQQEWRLPYICQLGVGLPAIPAAVQAYRVSHGREPFGNLMVPPRNQTELSDWQKRLHRYFELGTVYTMVAGLLNVLVIFDAWGGPAVPHPAEREPLPPDESARRGSWFSRLRRRFSRADTPAAHEKVLT